MRTSKAVWFCLLANTVGLGFYLHFVTALWDENKPTGELRARPRNPLTTLEQELYRRLLEAFPGMTVLAQVALSALISTPRKDRRRYHHKVVDFVLLDPDFKVLCAIELDDESQASRHTVGEPVKDLLELAGYRVFEFAQVPSVAQLRERVQGTPAARADSAAQTAGATVPDTDVDLPPAMPAGLQATRVE